MYHPTLSAEQITAYAHHLSREEKSAATLAKYLYDIRMFAAWLGSRPVTREAAAAWKAALVADRYAPTTINAKLSALNGLFRFLGWNDYRVKFLKIQRRLFREPERELTKPDYHRLHTAAQDLGRERLALLMETICATGIRVSEVRYITVEAVRQGRAEVALKGKIRVILLPGKLCRKLQKYARKQKTASGAIFRTKSGKPLDRRQIWAELKGLCRHAGVQETRVFPHNLRHLFATVFYQACRDIAKLADLLGHSSIETTRLYLLASGEEHRRALDRLGLVQ
ncbi:MAG: site-specific integrase [Clostridiales bacterium]|nr:site-specific integrase [Clostridiales bacterium]